MWTRIFLCKLEIFFWVCLNCAIICIAGCFSFSWQNLDWMQFLCWLKDNIELLIKWRIFYSYLLTDEMRWKTSKRNLFLFEKLFSTLASYHVKDYAWWCHANCYSYTWDKKRVTGSEKIVHVQTKKKGGGGRKDYEK